jgi:hypothetical protein
MKMEPMDPQPDRPFRIECSAALALAQDAIASARARSLSPEAEVHLEACSRCKAEVDAMEEVDEALSMALGAARRRIPGPTTRDIDAILNGLREPPPAAVLLGRIRRSVNRMLVLTLLVLSFLLVVLVAWALVRLAGGS